MGCTGNGLHKEWAALMACAQRARVDAAPGELGWQRQQATKMGGHAQQAAAHEVHLCGQSTSTPQRVALTQDGAHQGAHQHRGNNHDRVVGRETLQQRDAQTFMLMVALLVMIRACAPILLLHLGHCMCVYHTLQRCSKRLCPVNSPLSVR